MTRTPVRPDRPPRVPRRRLALLGLIIGLAAPTAPAAATPLALDSEQDVMSFAEKLRDYAGATRLRWIVAGRTEAEARATIARIESDLPPTDRYLSARLTAQTLEAAALPADGPAVRAFAAPQFGATPGQSACSWQLWVTDPRLPSAGAEAAMAPLAPNDRMPVSREATFRVGHTGLLQNRLYAFDETRPGAIRDLATAPDVNVPVSVEDGGETIILATARETTPFLENVKGALAASDGRRRDLGADFALRGKMLGKGRGIGANIQTLTPGMIATQPAHASEVATSHGEPLLETCIYALTPAK